MPLEREAMHFKKARMSRSCQMSCPLKNISAWTGTLGNQVLALEQNMNSQGKLLERKRKKNRDEMGRRSMELAQYAAPSPIGLSSLTKQPGGSSSSGSLHPHLQLRNPHSLRVSCLSG